MKKHKPIDDLQHIREIMSESSRFLTLSGLSGIFPGIFALLGALIAYFFVLDSGAVAYDEYGRALSGNIRYGIVIQLGIIALVVLVFSGLTAWYFSWRKARKEGKKMWTVSFRKWLHHLLLPLAAGGIFSIILVLHNNIDLVASLMLIFYGLALTSAGKFTFSEIHYLGLSEIVLGLLAGIFIHYGLLFWALGFGVMHIVYGIVMYIRHK